MNIYSLIPVKLGDSKFNKFLFVLEKNCFGGAPISDSSNKYLLYLLWRTGKDLLLESTIDFLKSSFLSPKKFMEYSGHKNTGNNHRQGLVEIYPINDYTRRTRTTRQPSINTSIQPFDGQEYASVQPQIPVLIGG